MGTKINNSVLNIVLNTKHDGVNYQHLPSIRYILMDAWIHFNELDS